MSIKNETPYSKKNEKSFWKTGVAAIHPVEQHYSSLHGSSPKKQTPRISSVGSCFAQHVGKWLIRSGYRFNQSQIETKQVSSFPFGNIYTPRCFIQWLDLATSSCDKKITAGIFKENNKYFDLLRPTFREQGFDSMDELISSRYESSQEMLGTITETDLLVFTLGLTEAWKDTSNIFYPSCPGVIAGEFNAQEYTFHNFTYEEIKKDIIEIRQKIMEINPEIQLLLTVSPVPLTATATDQHIMVASQYSKAVLRAVAGCMEATYQDILYFPSYEIITSPCHGDFRFSENLRTVTPQAVEYVMSHFKQMLDQTANEPAPFSADIKPNTRLPASFDETVCEEEMIEAIINLKESNTKNVTEKLILIGDSHLGKLSKAMNNLNIPHIGGMVMMGSAFVQRKFALCEEEYFVPLESAAARKIWHSIYPHLQANADLGVRSTIVTNIGIQTHQNASRFMSWIEANRPVKQNKITAQDMIDFLIDDQKLHLSLLSHLAKTGNEVVVISDPPFSKYFEESKGTSELIYAYHFTFEQLMKRLNIHFFNAATLFDNEISEPENYLSSTVFSNGSHDWYHGNERYYEWLATKIQTYVNSLHTRL
jgi:hypothetical protein